MYNLLQLKYKTKAKQIEFLFELNKKYTANLFTMVKKKRWKK